MAKQVNICVVGTGYVGLVSGACLSEIGHRVVCVDNDLKKISALKKGKIPIYEPGLDKIVHKNVRAKRLLFSTSIKEGMHLGGKRSEVVIIAVGTPPRPDGSADLSAIEHVAREVAENLKGYTLVVEKSTVPVETGDWIEKTVKRFNKKGVPFDVASNPEFLREGSAMEDFMKPDRVVIGVSSNRAERVMRDVYAPLKAKMVVTDIKSAELIKHASNSFLATKISYINAVAMLCEKVGADVEEIARGMGLDDRISPHFLRAGIGYGGFCFPKDLEAFYWISQQKGFDFSMLKAVKDVNEAAKMWPVRAVEDELWNLEGKTIGMLGLAFKPNTDDMRFAPAIDIVRELRARKVKVKAYDPVSMERAKECLKGVTFCKSAYETAKGVDALLLVTEWAEFKDLDFEKVRDSMTTPILIDGRNLYSPKKMRKLGFTYRSVGRS